MANCYLSRFPHDLPIHFMADFFFKQYVDVIKWTPFEGYRVSTEFLVRCAAEGESWQGLDVYVCVWSTIISALPRGAATITDGRVPNFESVANNRDADVGLVGIGLSASYFTIRRNEDATICFLSFFFFFFFFFLFFFFCTSNRPVGFFLPGQPVFLMAFISLESEEKKLFYRLGILRYAHLSKWYGLLVICWGTRRCLYWEKCVPLGINFRWFDWSLPVETNQLVSFELKLAPCLGRELDSFSTFAKRIFSFTHHPYPCRIFQIGCMRLIDLMWYFLLLFVIFSPFQFEAGYSSAKDYENPFNT